MSIHQPRAITAAILFVAAGGVGLHQHIQSTRDEVMFHCDQQTDANCLSIDFQDLPDIDESKFNMSDFDRNYPDQEKRLEAERAYFLIKRAEVAFFAALRRMEDQLGQNPHWAEYEQEVRDDMAKMSNGAERLRDGEGSGCTGTGFIATTLALEKRDGPYAILANIILKKNRLREFKVRWSL